MSVQQTIEQKIQLEFQPHFFSVENESHLHSSGRGAESHFKCVIVSNIFEGMRKVQRHQRIYQFLADELNSGVHSLSLHLFTAEEWDELNEKIPASTKCAGVGH